MTAVLAVLNPAHRHLLDPDACGGRAPRKQDPSHTGKTVPDRRLGVAKWPDSLVLHDSRSPVVGRRGLAVAADAVAERVRPDALGVANSAVWMKILCARNCEEAEII